MANLYRLFVFPISRTGPGTEFASATRSFRVPVRAFGDG